MTKTKLTFALLTLVTGLVGISQVQAGQGSFMLGHTAFENRCDANGGTFSPDGAEFACELDGIKIACLFDGADSFCDWTGAQNQRDVSRVLGAARAESLSDDHDGPGKKKLKLQPVEVKAILAPAKKP